MMCGNFPSLTELFHRLRVTQLDTRGMRLLVGVVA